MNFVETAWEAIKDFICGTNKEEAIKILRKIEENGEIDGADVKKLRDMVTGPYKNCLRYEESKIKDKCDIVLYDFNNPNEKIFSCQLKDNPAENKMMQKVNERIGADSCYKRNQTNIYSNAPKHYPVYYLDGKEINRNDVSSIQIGSTKAKDMLKWLLDDKMECIFAGLESYDSRVQSTMSRNDINQRYDIHQYASGDIVIDIHCQRKLIPFIHDNSDKREFKVTFLISNGQTHCVNFECAKDTSPVYTCPPKLKAVVSEGLAQQGIR